MELFSHLTWTSPFIGAVLALLLNRFGRLRGYVATFTLLVSGLSSTVLLDDVLKSPLGYLRYTYPWVPSIGVNVGVYVDTLAAFMAFIVAWLCFFIGFYSLKYMEGDRGLTRYWFYFTFFTGSMLLLVMADNLILMFIGWEGTGLASYALIGHWYTDEEEKCVGDSDRSPLRIPMLFTPSHSGVRAIMFTRLGDVGFISGIIILYTLTGTVGIPEIAEKAGEWGGLLAEKGFLLPFLLLFSLGALAKSAQFPFHEWLVTAMTGPTSVSALIHAATMVKAGVYFMLRFSPIFYSIHGQASISIFFTIIAYIGAFTAFLMASQAIVAREIKLVLAFSTASQLGYMFLAIGAAGLLPEFSVGFMASFNHLMSHAIFKASLFLAAGAVIHTVESRYLDDMGGLSKYMNLTFASTFIAALSLSGFPPFMGFWTKDSILEVVHKAGLDIPYMVAVVTAMFTAFYSMKIVLRTFLTPASVNVKHLEKEHKLHEANWIMWTPYAILSVICLAAGGVWFFAAPGLNAAVMRHVLAIEETHIEAVVHLDPMITISSVTVVFIGISLAAVSYLGPRYADAVKTALSSKTSLAAIHRFLYDRWYINAIYYRVVVNGFSWLSRNLFKWFDTLIIDDLYHKFIPQLITYSSNTSFRLIETSGIDRGYNTLTVKAALFLSRVFRTIQTGRVNHYLLTFTVGVTLIAALILLRLI